MKDRMRYLLGFPFPSAEWLIRKYDIRDHRVTVAHRGRHIAWISWRLARKLALSAASLAARLVQRQV